MHKVHTFEEIRARTPANPNEAAPDATMPQAAWQALLRDTVQGLRPPYTPRTLRRWLQATQPQAWAIDAPQSPPPPTTATTGRERARARGGQGTERDTPARGKEGPKVMGRCPQGQGTGSDTTWEQDTTHGPGRGGNRDRGAEKEDTTTGTRKGTPRRMDQHRPTPSGHRTTLGGARPQHTPPKHESDAVRTTRAHAGQAPETTQGKEGTPAREERAIPTEEAAENTATQPTTTPSAPEDDSGHSKGYLTDTRRGRRRGHST